MSEKRFCPSCGTHVEVGVIQRSGVEAHICVECGLDLRDAPADAPSEGATLHTVLIAEDTELLRTVLTDLFRYENVAENVIACENGEQFLEQAARTFRERGGIDLVVLDANMPIVDGYRAALALRAIERGLGVQVPTPILFFTSVAIDDAFRKVLERCAPARYVNKEASPGPRELVSRIRQILTLSSS